MLVDRFFFNCYNNIADLTKSMKELRSHMIAWRHCEKDKLRQQQLQLQRASCLKRTMYILQGTVKTNNLNICRLLYI